MLVAALTTAAPAAPLVEPLPAPLVPGEQKGPDGTIIYMPGKQLRGIVVALHGAGEGPSAMIERLRPVADARGLVLVAVKSAGDTWDAVASTRPVGAGPMGMKVARKPRLGPDPVRIAKALTSVTSRMLERYPVVLAGFSDGASEALTVGLADPKRYPSIIAMSPGLVVLPAQGIMSQKIFITHGRRDSVLSYAVSKSDIAGLLERVGYRPTFIAFEGDHRIDRKSLDTILDRLIGVAF